LGTSRSWAIHVRNDITGLSSSGQGIFGQSEFGAELLHAFDLRAGRWEVVRVRCREMGHHAGDAQAWQGHDVPDGIELLGKESAPPHSCVDVEVNVDRPPALHTGRRQSGRCLLAEQRDFESEAANGLSFGIRADAYHIGARINRYGHERFRPVPVGIGFHDDAGLRRRDTRTWT
jgi:hypothetical protein